MASDPAQDVKSSSSTEQDSWNSWTKEVETSLRSVRELVSKSGIPTTAWRATTVLAKDHALGKYQPAHEPANDYSPRDVLSSTIVPPYKFEVSKNSLPSILTDFTLPFGQFEGKKLSEVPTWYLQCLNSVKNRSPAFTTALQLALAASNLNEIELEWPSISTAPDEFHQWRKLKEGHRKSSETSLYISDIDAMKYFNLGNKILDAMKVEKLQNVNSSGPGVTRYMLYHIWHLVKFYLADGEADAALAKFLNDTVILTLSPREANELEIDISSRIASGSSGPGILLDFLSKNELEAARYMIEMHFETIAQGDFEWLVDLKDAQFRNETILDAILESTQPVPWSVSTPDERGNVEENDLNGINLPEEIIVSDFHQPGCVHRGPHCKDSASVSSDFSDDSDVQFPLSFDKMETVRAEVAELCGVAAGYPSSHYAGGEHQAIFEERYVRIAYQNLSPRAPIPRKVQVDSSLGETVTGTSYGSLTHTIIPGQSVVFLSRTTRRICKALRLLQEGGFCRDRLTVLVDRAGPNQGAVCMAPIELKDITAFHITAQELYTHYRYAWGGTEQSIGDIPLSADPELHRKLSSCWLQARALLRQLVSLELPDSQTAQGRNTPLHLHECILTCQPLAVAVISYAQAHTSDFQPHFLKEPIERLILSGYAEYQPFPLGKVVIELSYKQLACMGNLVGGKVIVLRMFNELPSEQVKAFGSNEIDIDGGREPVERLASLFIGSIEDIVDSWGPGVLITDPEEGTPYGDKIKALFIGSGAITRVSDNARSTSDPLYHFGSFFGLADAAPTFDICTPLTIGAITVQITCPLDPAKCRKSSEPFLDTLGASNDYWELAEQQMMFSAGQYVGLQVGNVYSKVKGRPMKTAMMERWRLLHDFRILLQPWGLQVSLCTGVARRVSLRELIEGPMFLYIDKLALPDWDEIKADIRTAFAGTSEEYMTWVMGLKGS